MLQTIGRKQPCLGKFGCIQLPWILHNSNEGGRVRPCLCKHIYTVPLFVIGSCRPSVLKKVKWARSAKSIGWISMERHQNQNAFTWKRIKLTVCITAQYKSVTMMGFKVKEVAENMLTPSTVGSFISTKSPQTRNLAQILQKCQRNRPRQA